MDEMQEKVDGLTIRLYGVIRQANIPLHESFFTLIALAGALGNEAGLSEEEMLAYLKCAIQSDKQMQRMELQ